MQRVTRNTAVTSLPAPPSNPGAGGFFTGGSPSSGVAATVPGYEWFNTVQEELVAVVQAGGLTLNPHDNTQLQASLNAQFAGLSGNNTFTGTQTITAAAGNSVLNLNAPPDKNAWLVFSEGGNEAWWQGLATDSSGNYQIKRYGISSGGAGSGSAGGSGGVSGGPAGSPSPSLQDIPLSISAATGVINLAQMPTVGGNAVIAITGKNSFSDCQIINPSAAKNTYLGLVAAAGYGAYVGYHQDNPTEAGLAWRNGMDPASASGNFELQRYVNSSGTVGSYVDSPITVNAQTGVTSFSKIPTVAGFSAGAGSVATTGYNTFVNTQTLSPLTTNAVYNLIAPNGKNSWNEYSYVPSAGGDPVQAWLAGMCYASADNYGYQINRYYNGGAEAPFSIAGGYSNGPGAGAISLGSTNTGANVTINNNILPLNSNLNIGSSGALFHNVYATGGVISTSDQRKKTNIAPLPPMFGLSLVNAVKPVSYNNLEADATGALTVTGDRTHFGLVAQDFQALLASLGVASDKQAIWCLADPADPTSGQLMRYSELMAPMLLAIQELSAQVAALTAQVQSLLPPPTPTPTPTPTPAPTETPVPAPTDTPVPTVTPDTPVPAPTDTPVPTVTPDTPVPAPTDTPVPTVTPDTPVPAPTDTPVPTVTPDPGAALAAQIAALNAQLAALTARETAVEQTVGTLAAVTPAPTGTPGA
jgi:hypothetical protein